MGVQKIHIIYFRLTENDLEEIILTCRLSKEFYGNFSSLH